MQIIDFIRISVNHWRRDQRALFLKQKREFLPIPSKTPEGKALQRDLEEIINFGGLLKDVLLALKDKLKFWGLHREIIEAFVEMQVKTQKIIIIRKLEAIFRELGILVILEPDAMNRVPVRYEIELAELKQLIADLKK